MKWLVPLLSKFLLPRLLLLLPLFQKTQCKNHKTLIGGMAWDGTVFPFKRPLVAHYFAFPTACTATWWGKFTFIGPRPAKNYNTLCTSVDTSYSAVRNIGLVRLFVYVPLRLGDYVGKCILWCWLKKRGEYIEDFEISVIVSCRSNDHRLQGPPPALIVIPQSQDQQ